MRELPAGWKEVTLDEVTLSVRDGTHTPPKRVANGIPLLSARNIQDGRVDLNEAYSYISEVDFEQISRTNPVEKGDVLLTIVGTIGRSCVNELEEPFAVQRSVAIIRPKSGVSPKYLSYAFREPLFQDQLTDASSGTAQAGVYLGALKRTVVRLPSLEEQERIVAKLNEVLARVSACRERLDKFPKRLARFRQAVLAAACTGKLTEEWRQATSGVASDGSSEFGTTTEAPIEIPGSWTWKTTVDLARPKPSSICAGPFGTIFKAKDFRQDGVPIIFLRHVAPGRYLTAKPGFMDRDKWLELFQPYSVYGGELLITKLGV